MGGYTKAFRHYATFDGRTRRADYWQFVLVNLIILLLLNSMAFVWGRASDGGFTALGAVAVIVTGIYLLVTLLPRIALDWRRFHDIGWPGAVSIIGWFVPLLTLIVACIPGNPGPNQYGPDPKA